MNMKIKSLSGVLFFVSVVASCDPADVTVTPQLDVDKESVSLTAEAGEASFNVTSNYEWKASADVEWISLDPASGTASDKAVKVSVTADDNDTEEERTAIVTVEVLGTTISKIVTVTQAAAEKEEPAPAPRLDVDKESVSLTAEAGEASFNITSNQDWTAAADVDWISLDPASGAASDEAVQVSVTAGDNETEQERTATITVTAGTLTKTVTVSQAAAQKEEPVVSSELDGNQWIADYEGRKVLFDFGITEEGMLSIALPTMDETGFGLFMAGLYEIESKDETSGTIYFTQYDWEWDEFLDESEFEYSDLTESSVKIICETVFGVSDPISFVRSEEPVEIIFDNGESDGPSGSIENGDYWFFNGDKVMAPLAEGVTSGYLPAVEAVDGEGAPENLFTLVYDPDMSAYTIQDSFGRYLGNEGYGEEITLVDKLPSGGKRVYYYWVVDPGFDDGTCDVYNQETWNGFAYSADDDHWFASMSAYETDGVRPTLVMAE